MRTKEQKREYLRNWRKQNPEKCKSYTKNYRQTHKKQYRERMKKFMRKYRLKNPEKYKTQHRIASQRNRRKIKAKIFQLLGNKCVNPFNLLHPDWCNDPCCLQIDHIHGGGSKEISSKRGGTYYRYVLAQIKAGSKDYQLLCANCNWIKRFENEEGFVK